MIKLEYGMSWILESEASALLACVAERCPLLQALVILPQPDNWHNNEDWESAVPSSALTSCGNIARMSCLRDLVIGKYFLQDDSLVSIGLLPALETLVIHESPREHELSIFDAQMPESLFPALRHLTLRMIDSCEVAQIWRVDSLVKNLAHATIIVVPADSEYTQKDGKHGLVDWLPYLFQNSLCIQHLSVVFETDGYVDIQPVTTLSLLTIIQLPLQSISLVMVDIIDFDNFCKQLAKSCPSISRLCIPYTEVALSSLPQITGDLKHLKHLSINVSWRDLPPEGKLGWSQSSRSLTTLEYSDYDINCDNNLSVSDTAMFLLAIWPNLKGLHPPMKAEPDPDTVPGMVVQLLSSAQEFSLGQEARYSF